MAKRFYFLVQASTVKTDLSVCCFLCNGLIFLPKEVRSNLLNSCLTTKIRELNDLMIMKQTWGMWGETVPQGVPGPSQMQSCCCNFSDKVLEFSLPPTPFISRFASQQMLIEDLLSPGIACHPGASHTKPSRTQTFKFPTGIADSFTTSCKFELNTTHRTQRLWALLCFWILSHTKTKPFGVFKFKGNGRRFAGEKIQTPPSLVQ